MRLDRARAAGARPPSRPRPTSRGIRLGVPEELLGRGHRGRGAGALRGDAGAGARARRDRRDDAAAACAARARRLLPDRARRVLQRTWRATTGSAMACAPATPTDLLAMYMRTRARGFGPEVKRRIMLGTFALSAGYYDAYYGTRPAGPDADRRRLPRAFERVDLRRAPTSRRPSPSSSGAKTADPLAMYLNDLLHGPDVAWPGSPAISFPTA